MEKTSRKLPRLQSILDFALVLGGTGFATGTGFILKIFIGRQLGPEALGIFAVCYGVLSVLAIVADLGVRYSMVTLAAQTWETEPTRARGYLASAFGVKLLGGLLVLSFGWLTAALLADAVFHKPHLQPFLQITMVGVMVWSLWDGIEGALHIRQRFSVASALRILMDIIRLAAFFTLLFQWNGVWFTMDRYLWIYYVAPALSFLIGALLVQAWMHPNWSQGLTTAPELIAFSRGVFLYRTFTMALLFMDSLMLGRYGELSHVGEYEAAKGLAYALLLVSETLGMVLLPKVNLIKAKEELQAFLHRFLRYLAVFGLAGLVWLAVASNFLGLFGPKFTEPNVVRTFQVLVISTLVTVPGTLLGTVLLALKRPFTLARVALIQVVAGLFLYPWTSSGGIVSTAMTTVVLQFAGSLALYWRVRIHLR